MVQHDTNTAITLRGTKRVIEEPKAPSTKRVCFKLTSTYKRMVHIDVLPEINSIARRELNKDIQLFQTRGLLVPVDNPKLGAEDHFVNRSADLLRVVPYRIYDRVLSLPRAVRIPMFPGITFGVRSIKPDDRPLNPAWLIETDTVRKEYDRLYWRSRLYQIPYLKAWNTNYDYFNLSKRVHDYHKENSIQRNSKLKNPPAWFTQEIFQC
jgi:hypothetical protein